MSWIQCPRNTNELDNYVQFLSNRLAIIEREKYKLELEKYDILNTLWGNKDLSSKYNKTPTLNIKNAESLSNSQDLTPFLDRKLHDYSTSQSLNEILQMSNLSSRKSDDNTVYDIIDFSKLDLIDVNLMLAHFGINNVSSDHFDQGVQLLNQIRDYLLDKNEVSYANINGSNVVHTQSTEIDLYSSIGFTEEIDELLNSIQKDINF